jgi:hypothetical protein
MANSELVTSSPGFAILRVVNHFTIDEVVFAEKGDRRYLLCNIRRRCRHNRRRRPESGIDKKVKNYKIFLDI